MRLAGSRRDRQEESHRLAKIFTDSRISRIRTTYLESNHRFPNALANQSRRSTRSQLSLDPSSRQTHVTWDQEPN